MRATEDRSNLQRLPVTVLSGFLGAGKTTLLNHLSSADRVVLIGIGMDERDLRARFDACLLTDAELAQGADGWRTFVDRFDS